MFVTHSPCKACAGLIQYEPQKMFKRLFYQNDYRDLGPLTELCSFVDVYKITPSGYITEFRTGQLMNPESFY